MPSASLVSIITPSYNQADYLEETILSVLSQDYLNLEYLVIDGGSTDGSLDIIRKYRHRLAYWVSEPDLGQSHAVNKGFERANGEILAWLNSDDILCPGAVRLAAGFLDSHPDVSVVYGGGDFIDAEGRAILPMPREDFDLARCLLRLITPIPNAAAFFRRDTIRQIGLLNQELHYIMDTDYWIRVGLAGSKISRIPETLAHIRLHPDSKTVGKIPKSNEELLAWVDRFFLQPLPPEIATLERQSRSRALLELGLKYFYVNEFSSGRRAVFKGAFLHPPIVFKDLFSLLLAMSFLPVPAIKLALLIKRIYFASPNQQARQTKRGTRGTDRCNAC